MIHYMIHTWYTTWYMYHLHAPWYYVLQNVSSMIQPVWGREVSTLVDTRIMYVSCMYHLSSKLPEMIHKWYIHDTCINRWYTMIQHDTRWYTRRSVSSLIHRWYRDDTEMIHRIGKYVKSDRKQRRSRGGTAHAKGWEDVKPLSRSNWHVTSRVVGLKPIELDTWHGHVDSWNRRAWTCAELDQVSNVRYYARFENNPI